MADLKKRSVRKEIMDDPGSDKKYLFATLRQFKLINQLFTRCRFLAINFIVPHFRRQNLASFTLFDLGAGGCDFALWFSRYLTDRGMAANIVCIDNDPRVVEFGRAACSGNKSVSVLPASALQIDELDLRPDYIFSCHLLHHLSDSDVVTLLRQVNERARLGYVLTDIERSGRWHFLFGLFSALFLRNSFARADGLLSIGRSFTKAELESLVSASGITPHPRVRRMFPGRLVVEHFADKG